MKQRQLPASQNLPNQGFVLIDALIALIVSASVLAAIYSLISSSAQASAASRNMAIAAVAANSLCVEASRIEPMRAAMLERASGAMWVRASIEPESRPDLTQTMLWRLTCSAGLRDDPIVTLETYTLARRHDES